MNEIREFLTSRRARISPAEAGLKTYGGRRRVSGLRREELAMSAAISVDYSTQLERGNVRGVSEDVLEAVTRALRLTDLVGDLSMHSDEFRSRWAAHDVVEYRTGILLA